MKSRNADILSSSSGGISRAGAGFPVSGSIIIPAFSSTISSAKMGTLTLTAKAMASLGRESISI